MKYGVKVFTRLVKYFLYTFKKNKLFIAILLFKCISTSTSGSFLKMIIRASYKLKFQQANSFFSFLFKPDLN